MRLLDRLDPALRLFRQRARRSWVTLERAHVEFGSVGRAELPAFEKAVRAASLAEPRLRGAEVNLHTRRVVFSFDEGALDVAALVRIVRDAESAAGVQEPSFEHHGEHPADREPQMRRLLSLTADTLALFGGLGLSVLPIPAVPFAGTAAALLSLVEGVDRLREELEVRIGPERTELALELGQAGFSALAQRPYALFVDVIHKAVRLREAQSRTWAWERLEPALHPSKPAPGIPAAAAVPEVEPRPVALPRGPIEEYADRAWIVSLGGFAVSFVTSRSVQRAIAALYGSLPRPAQLGREVFCSEMGRILAARDALVMRPEALRKLDRIDCLVLPGDLVSAKAFGIGAVHVLTGGDEARARAAVARLFDADRPLERRSADGYQLAPFRITHAAFPEELEQRSRSLSRQGALVLALEREGKVEAAVEVTITARTGLDELVRAAHEAGMRVVMASSDEAILQAVSADDVISDSEGIVAGIRRLQREGRGVCFAATGDSPGLPVADLGVGLCRAGAPTPWGSDIICPDDLTELRLLLRACARARRVSKQSVNIALGAAAFGTLVSAGGLLPLSMRRVLFVVNTASLMSMANGLRGSMAVRRLELPPSRDPTPWHALDAEGVLGRLGGSREGLSRVDVAIRQSTEVKAPSALRELGEAITDELFNPLAPLLAAGAGLSAAVGSMTDAAMVGTVVGMNAFVGGVQRFATERKLRLLARTEKRRAAVRRDSRIESVDAASLVPGDVVLLQSGDVVPADCRVYEASALEVDASSLTGESLPVKKFAAPSYDDHTADRNSMLYEGTTVVAGQATAIVVAVGDHTEARRGAAGSKGTRANAGVERRLRGLMNLTGPIAAAAGVGVVGGGLLRGRKLDELVGAGVSLAVASVPEGLPLLATAAQLAAAERLAQRGAIVRNSRAIEALGRVDVVCLDKTGTVTEGVLALSSVCDGEATLSAAGLPRSHFDIVAAGLRATIHRRPGAPGDPLDSALETGALALGVDASLGAAAFRRVSELSLSLGRSYHAVLGKSDDGARLSVKGAPEVLLLQCTSWRRADRTVPLDDDLRMALVRKTTELAGSGLRVLAVAERAIPADAALDPSHVVDLTFRGFLAFRDPVRPSAAAAIDGLRRAGVRTVMITGDHPSTAQSIARELSLGDGSAPVTGAELAAMTDDELDARVSQVSVFARVTPSQKVRVVRALSRSGRVVAMAGDGANDAAAIRLADVGIAIGEQCTQAARAAADVVLTDGRVETIVQAVVEGRALWVSVRDAVSILMGGNLGEIGFTLLAGLVDGRPPLHARQLLLVNLLTDIAPAMAIALKAPAPRTFEALARETPEFALGAPLRRDVAQRAIVTALGAGMAWGVGRIIGNPTKARTIGLLALVGTQLGQTMTSGGFSRPVVATSLLSAGLLSMVVQTPGVSHFFGCRPLGPISWSAAIGASALATAMSGAVGRVLSGDFLTAKEPEGAIVPVTA